MGGKPSKAPDPAPGFKVPNPKTGAKWHNLFRSRGGAKREVRMAPVKSAEELRKQQDKEELAKKEKEKRAAFLRQRQETGRTREKLLMVPHGFQPTPDAGKRKVMQMPAPRNLALASFDSNPGGAAMTPGRQAAIAMMQTPLPARRRDSVSMTPARGNSRLSEVMSTPAAMSTPRGAIEDARREQGREQGRGYATAGDEHAGEGNRDGDAREGHRGDAVATERWTGRYGRYGGFRRDGSRGKGG